jgi:hypothetical protein
MRRPLALLTAIAVAGMLTAAPAMAQDELPDVEIAADVTATPNKAGTKRDPQGLMLSGTGEVVTEPGFEPPVVTDLDLLIGKGIVDHGDDYVQCSKRVLDRRGPSGCPKKSVMGSAIGTAKADTVTTHPKILFLNGGTTRLFAYTTLYFPALVQETIVVTTTKLTGRWQYRVRATVPENLRVVAGVPIQLTGVRFKLGGKRYAPRYITSTSCPKGGWKYRATAHYEFNTGQTGQDSFSSTVPCRK